MYLALARIKRIQRVVDRLHAWLAVPIGSLVGELGDVVEAARDDAVTMHDAHLGDVAGGENVAQELLDLCVVAGVTFHLFPFSGDAVEIAGLLGYGVDVLLEETQMHQGAESGRDLVGPVCRMPAMLPREQVRPDPAVIVDQRVLSGAGAVALFLPLLRDG